MLTGLVVVLLLLIALLAIPLTLTYRVSWPQGSSNDTRLLWAFGLVRVRIPSRQSRIAMAKSDEAEQHAVSVERSSNKKPNVLAALRRKAFRGRIKRFARDMWRAIQKENVILRLRVGLGDPADTGQLWAIFGPLAGAIAHVRELAIDIEPDFFDTTLELDSSGSIRVIPLQMIWLTLGLLLSPPVWRGLREMRRGA